MFKVKKQYWLLLVACLLVQPAYALQVVVTIPPLAGLVKPLLADSDEVTVLLKPGLSPHGFQLKPSHLKALAQSDLLVSVGTPVDAWINKSSERLSITNLKMSQLASLQTYPIRNSGVWAEELYEEGGHHHHHDHHGHHHDHHAHEALKYDGHLWMSMHNAQAYVKAVAKWLKTQQPSQAEAINQREQAWLKQLQKTENDILNYLQPVKNYPYLVLHDAYQYFEKQFQLNGAGSVRLSPELSPSLKRIGALRQVMQERDVQCVFQEPQFPKKHVLSVVRGLEVNVGMLNPMGTVHLERLADAPWTAYDEWMWQLARSVKACLER